MLLGLDRWLVGLGGCRLVSFRCWRLVAVGDRARCDESNEAQNGACRSHFDWFFLYATEDLKMLYR